MSNSYTQLSRVFISYSHKDEKWLKRLNLHLTPLVRESLLDVWSDKHIIPGSDWKKEIEAAIDSAKVAVLLVTPEFAASDFIHKNELPPLLEKAEMKGVTILWVHVSHTLFESSVFAKYQAAHDLSKPLDSMKKPEWTKSLNAIVQAIEKAAKKPSKSPLHSKQKRTTGQASPQPAKKSKSKRARANAEVSVGSLGKPDADHCINQFIHYVRGANQRQTEEMRSLLGRVMIDGLSPEEAWLMLGLEPTTARRLWFMSVKLFTQHFNKYVSQLLEFQKALQLEK